MIAQNRNTWVSYLRVSTQEQAEKDLSLPAQRGSVEAYAKRHGKVIDHEYIESGRSGTDGNRKIFRQMLEDVLKPGSDIEVIIVHHTSRFTRNATQARVVKEQLRKKGVRVISVCQDINDDPIGQLIEGIFECIDQYESEVNGMRTAAAMREAIRQGYFPGSMPPYGFKTTRVEVKPGLYRSILTVDEEEAVIVHELFQLYVANSGAKSVARMLNQQGHWYRKGKMWSNDLVLKVLGESAVAGTYYWGKRETKTRRLKDPSEWLSLKVEPIVDLQLFEPARHLRSERGPARKPGRAASPETLLRGFVRCGKCGSSYTLEVSGKRVAGEIYKYRYYNCRSSCRIGKEACSGGRIATKKLDDAVVNFIAGKVCTQERCTALLGQLFGNRQRQRQDRQLNQLQTDLGNVQDKMISWRSVLSRNDQHKTIGQLSMENLSHNQQEIVAKIKAIKRNSGTQLPTVKDKKTVEILQRAWSSLIRNGKIVGRNYLHHLIDRIEVDENQITIFPKQTSISKPEIQKENAVL